MKNYKDCFSRRSGPDSGSDLARKFGIQIRNTVWNFAKIVKTSKPRFSVVGRKEKKKLCRHCCLLFFLDPVKRQEWRMCFLTSTLFRLVILPYIRSNRIVVHFNVVFFSPFEGVAFRLWYALHRVPLYPHCYTQILPSPQYPLTPLPTSTCRADPQTRPFWYFWQLAETTSIRIGLYL